MTKFKSNMPIVQKDNVDSIIESLEELSKEYNTDGDYLLRANIRIAIEMLRTQGKTIADLVLENHALNRELTAKHL